jgi:hypothetical protein
MGHSFRRYSQFIASLIICFLVPMTSHAVITITSVTNASEHEFDDEKKLTIFGGIVGPTSAGDCTGGNTSVCSNCVAARTACNDHRVLPTVEFSFTIESDKATAGEPLVLNESNGVVTSTSTSTAGNKATVKILWADLCKAASDDAACTTGGTHTLKVGFDGDGDNQFTTTTGTSPDDNVTVNLVVSKPTAGNIDTITNCNTAGTGVCGYELFPGDEKIYIIDLEKPDGFPTVGSTKFNRIRLFLEEGSADPDNASDYTDLKLITEDNEISIEDNRITGLTNDQLYTTRMASIDQAGNIAYFTDPAKSANPSEVIGLLSQDFNCFISTAAYGSSFHSKVQTFRDFRNRIMLGNRIGKRAIHIYNRYGAQLARKIAPSEFLRAVARVCLWPLWVFADLSLAWGFSFTFAFFLIGFLSLGFVVYLATRQFKKLGAG